MHPSLTILTNLIIQEYFANLRCVILIKDTNSNFVYYGSLPIVVIHLGKNVSFQEIILKKYINHYYGCQGILLQSKNPLNVFTKVEQTIRFSIERFNRRKYLILPPENPASLSQFFGLRELNYVVDILLLDQQEIVLQTENISSLTNEHYYQYSLFTHNYVGELNCSKRILLDVWFSTNQSFQNQENLYPNKLRNQFGRPLRMAFFRYEPYAIYNENTSQKFYGSELSAGALFARYLNMTPTPVINENDEWGTIFPNWTGNGVLGNLVEDNADIGFAALYTWAIFYSYLDLSKPLIRTGITCLVPAPKLAANWTTPFLSFPKTLWILCGVLFLYLIFALSFSSTLYDKYKIKTIKNHKTILIQVEDSVIQIWQLILMQPMAHLSPKYTGIKTIFILVLFTSLFLTTCYSSGLSSIMTVPRYGEAINTVEEFSASQIQWGATSDAWTTSIKSSTEKLYMDIVNNFNVGEDAQLRDISLTRPNFAFSIERLPYGSFAIGTYVQKDTINRYHLMNEDLYWEQCLFYFRKSSILAPVFDMFILRVFAAGLTSKWQNEAVFLYMDPYVQNAVRYYSQHQKVHDQEVAKLKYRHVEGGFVMLMIGLSVSACVFVIEILVHFLKKTIIIFIN